MMKQNCLVCKIVGALVIIGALNWGLIGLLQKDAVVMLLGSIPKAVRITYILVGLAGVLKIICCFKDCPACCKK